MKRLELLDNLVVVLEELGAQAVDIVQPFITNIVQIYKYGFRSMVNLYRYKL